MDFRILGPLEVRDRGGSVELRGQKPRALLAVLLLSAGEPLTSDVLIDALWGETPPRTARAALQNYILRLRRALGPGVVESRRGGYAVEIGPEQVDLGRFERLTAEARVAGGGERVEKLREALALWRGPPLADLAYEPFAAREAARLEELRTAALEDLIDARLALGAGSELVPELEQLIAEHPFRERLRGQLMLALYRGGRQADALEAYQQTRRTLVEELGIDPGASLRELEQAILRQDPALAPHEPDVKAPRPEGERRKTITVLLADIASPETVDPELVHDSSIRALARMRTVLEEHGATAEQRAGDEVLAVFGIPRAHEDDALRAVRAALELEVELDGLSDALESEGRGRVELRVAVETGPALVGADETGHGFAAGPAVASAKRALQRAEPGEILAGPGTLRLLGDTAVLVPSHRGDPRIVELLEGVPALAREAAVPLVDREAELAALHRAFAEAVEQRCCRLFLLLGEPGIGKSRVALELSAELERTATIVVGRCVSYGKGATFLPLAEVIAAIRERRPLEEVLAGDEHAELIAARLAALTGEQDTPGSGGETFWAVRRLFEALARERPLVVVLEDLHWAEPTLLDLIDYLAERIADAPILLLGLSRPELLETRPAWSERETRSLAPLSGDYSDALIGNLGAIPAQLRTEIVDTAGGNPLFIEQLLAHARESPDAETLPPSLDALLTSRLDRLEPGELAVLQRASVAGREFRRDEIRELMEDGDARVDDHLEAAVRKGLIHARRPEPAGRRYRFHHVLIRDAAYATLPLKQRATLHERYARRLEVVNPRGDELIGFHLEQAHACHRELGVEAEAASLAAEAGSRLGTAGLRAWRRADAATTLNLLGRAVGLLPRSEPSRLELLCELGLALRTSGEIERAEEVLREASAGAAADDDRRLELRARLELANVRLASNPEGTTDALLRLATEAMPTFEEFGDDRSLGRTWLLSGYVHGGLHCQNSKWNHAAERALVHYRRAGWPTTACFGEIATSLYHGPTPVREAVPRCEQLLGEVSDHGAEAHVLVALGGLEALRGDFDAGRARIAEASAIYDDLGYTFYFAAGSCSVLSDLELLAGDLEAAEQSLRLSCELLEAMNERVCFPTRAAELAEAIYRRGRYEEADRWTRTAEARAATDDVGAQLLWRGVRAKTLARRGSVAEGERLALDAVALADETDALNRRAKARLDLAEVSTLGGRPLESVRSTEVALELFERKGNRAGADHVRRVLAGAASGDGMRAR